MIYTIFVFELAGNKYLLCPSTDDCSALECFFMYPEAFREQRLSARLITTHQNIEDWQIDGLVHLYMHKYGTNNVIGGSYTKFGDNHCTSDHIKFIVDGLEELNNRKEKCRRLQTQDLSADYTTQLSMYNNLVQLKDQYHIDRCIVGELGWLYDLIINDTYKPENYCRYNGIMHNLALICKRARKLGIIDSNFHYPYPRAYFDSRVIEHKTCDLTQVINTCELAIYTMINREDELLYDMEQIDIDNIRDYVLMQQFP